MATTVAAAAVETDTRPWDERFRPVRLDQIAGNTTVIGSLQIAVDDSCRWGELAESKGPLGAGKPPPVPHFLFSGPPGTGKTSAAYCVVRHLFGHRPDALRLGMLEVNGSEDRVFERIRAFARERVVGGGGGGGGGGRGGAGGRLPSHLPRVVVFDEVDHMSGQQQQALRRLMSDETIERNVRFVLVCNNSARIIQPIQSICCIMRFQALGPGEVSRRVRAVLQSQSVPFTEDGVEAIVFTADGDLRQAINNLQSTHVGHGAVTSENVFKVCDQPHPSLVRRMVDECLRGDVRASTSTLGVLLARGFAASDIVGTLFRVVRLSMDLPENVKFELLREVGVVHVRNVEGCASALQLQGMCTRMCTVATTVRGPTE